jgi:hypothetical protein
MEQCVAWKGTLFLPRCGSESHEEGGKRNYALCDKEKYMNQIDQQDPCELLRTAGFTEAEIAYLERLRRAYSENSSWLTPAEERRLAFVRWLVTTGRLTEQVEA